MLTLRDLNECFDQAKEVGASLIAVKVRVGDSADETIINPSSNFEEKIAYYNNTYSEILRHKFSVDKEIQITAFAHGGSYKELERNLEIMIHNGYKLN